MPSTIGARVELPEQGARYARDVLRLPVGERVELFDGHGLRVLATLTTVDASGVIATIQELLPEDENESSLELTLYQAIPKGDRFEWLLEKCTELGVTRICPIETSRTVVKIKPNKSAQKLERWQKITAGAARQSQRSRVPELLPARSFASALEDLELRGEHDLVLVASPPLNLEDGDGGGGFQARLKATPSIATLSIWIGPEGGFTNDEVRALLDAGAQTVSMGPRILRAETAAVTAIALAQHLAGDLR